MTLSPGTTLGTYEILAPLGAGGMGEVYRARDTRLARDVAIKVLPGDFLEGEERRLRFEREAKLLAALNHPNIAAIYSFEEIPGSSLSSSVPVLVMELLEGETLRTRLAAGALPVRKAVDYAAQIARGLAAAHEKGVVHRDLKPENVFVTKDGRIKILDFGLAKSVPAAAAAEETSAPTASRPTEPGTVLGTVSYMSPEQVRGLPLDPRSDVFSFGVVLYEMLSGRRAFKRDTGAETMTAILKEDPPELSESGRNIPPALDRIVRHCLEKSPEQRFGSAHDIAFALEEAVAGAASGQRAATPATRNVTIPVLVGAAVLLAVAGAFLLLRQKGTGRSEGPKRVAVLPFENLGAAEDDYFVDGVADEVRGKLTSVSGLQVIARASSTPYKKTTKTPQQIAGELNAPYLLTGTVRWEKSGGTSRVHVSPELVDVTRPDAPTSKWQQPFDASLTDVFRVQSDIASKVAQALGFVLGTGEQKRLSEKPTENLAAYDAFLKGEETSRGMGVSDPPSLRKALDSYEKAVALDPGFAQAWARTSMASSLLYGNGAHTPELAERARQGAQKAVALASDRPEGYLALGNTRLLVDSDPGAALESYARGQQLTQTNAELLTWTARAEETLGRWEAALELFKQAQRLDPRSVITQRRLGQVLLFLRRFPEAREALDRALTLAPANPELIDFKAITYLGEGNLSGARAVFQAAPKGIDPTALVAFAANYNDLVWVLGEKQQELLLRLTPSAFDGDRAVWGVCLAQALALKGDAAGARSYAEEARKAFGEPRATPDDAQRHSFLGLSLAYLGRKEEAIREGKRAVALLPTAKDAYLGPYVQHQLVRIYILVGEPERALDLLEPLLKIPYPLSPDWLRIDPNFDPLRKNPRFQRLVDVKS